MLLSTKQALIWTAAGTVVGTVLFAGYLLLSAWGPERAPTWPEQIAGVAVLSALAAGTVVWAARRKSRQTLEELSDCVVALREDPALNLIQSLPPEWGPFSQQLDALAKCYRQALADYVAHKQAFEDLQWEQKQAEVNVQSLEGRADKELGQSLFRLRRWDTNSRNMVARLTPNFHWMAATAALQQFLGCTATQLNGRPFFDVVHPEDVAYYKELIPLHEKSHPHRGIGNGTLSSYYSGQAKAYAGLHDTPHAVEAAAGAVVAWGPRQDLRQAALDTLKQVLASASDLDAYVASLDKQNEQMPIVRKALGLVYFDKSKFTQAIAQLRAAVELQPNDTETHQKLIACYDKLGDQDGAIRQLLQSLQLSRRDLKLYQDLGRRYEKNHESKETERAYTSIVEVLPSEAESHALLAEIREAQNRWPEAIVQWDQAARLRALEPTDLVKLAAAQIHERRWDDAADTLRRLKSRSWPARFDVNTQMHDLEKKLEQGRKQ